MSDQTEFITQKLIKLCFDLRDFVVMYDKLDTNEKSNIRHEAYINAGGFGKLITCILTEATILYNKLPVRDLGFQNDWPSGSVPSIVTRCTHTVEEETVAGVVKVSCPICKYVYHFDRS